MNSISQFYRFSLYALASFCLFAPSIGLAANGTSTIAPSQDTLSDWIRTGVASHDSRSYWNCSISGQPETKNLHVRFWRTGSGFSGHHKLNWEAVSNTELLLSVDEQRFKLTEISFNTGDSKPSKLFAKDSTGAGVLCDWSGPARGSIHSEAQFDAATDLLASQLTAAELGAWNCTITDKHGEEHTQSLTFSHTGVGVRDDDKNFLWFVDRRYNVLLSFARETNVLRDFQFFSDVNDDDRFVAYELSNRLECIASS